MATPQRGNESQRLAPPETPTLMSPALAGVDTLVKAEAIAAEVRGPRATSWLDMIENPTDGGCVR